jgi:hypothetical protein
MIIVVIIIITTTTTLFYMTSVHEPGSNLVPVAHYTVASGKYI